jgi:hypothetical protein
MPPKRISATRTVWLTIAATVGAGIILSLLYSVLSVWNDVATMKTQQLFYHGTWPPPYREPAIPIPTRERGRE